MRYLLCHYAEIGLKGKNRRFFEEKLMNNLKKLALEPADFDLIKRISGMIIVRLTEEGVKREKELKEKLKCVFGLANFAFAERCPQKIEEIEKKVLEILKKEKFSASGAASAGGQGSAEGGKTFRISAKRSNKNFPLNSQKINERIGATVLKKIGEERKIKVDLENPEITVFIEVVQNYAFVYLQKIKGPGGLPVGSGGRVLSLISGGIDSPVASWFLFKRGAEVIFLHFHSFPQTDKASQEKTKEVIRKLSVYQTKTKLYLVPFLNIQKEVLLKAPADLRVIFYRRLMFKIAEKIAKKEKVLALLTGENLGQVASQTLENLGVIEKGISLPVFRPLIGFDKEEIISRAKEIGTYQISILPHQDCCSLFIPRHPATKASLFEVEAIEKKLKIKKLLNSAYKKAEEMIL